MGTSEFESVKQRALSQKQRALRSVSALGIVLGVICLSSGLGCGAASKDPTTARAAVYQADFDSLFQAMALEVKRQYPNLAARPHERVVKTAWHPLPLKERVSTREDSPNVRGASKKRSGSPTSQANPNAGFSRDREFRRNATRVEKRFFVRFNIRLEAVGGPGAGQWKVNVTGEASEWDGTGVPSLLKGAERPYWLDGRSAKLEIAIYNRLKKIATVVAPAAY